MRSHRDVYRTSLIRGVGAGLYLGRVVVSSTASADLFDDELEAQAVQLTGRLVDTRERLARARAFVTSLEEQEESEERLLEHVQSLLPSARQPSLDTLDQRLRGARLRSVAVEILAARATSGEPVHYRDWYAWVNESGFRVAGRDPLATFLAQITRAPRVTRVGGARSGRYALTG